MYKAIKIRINKQRQHYKWCKTICKEARSYIDQATYLRRQNLFQGKETGTYKTEKQLSKEYRDNIDKTKLGHTQLTTTIWNKTRTTWNNFYKLIKKGNKTKPPGYLKHKTKYGTIEYHLGQNNSPARIKNGIIHFNGTHKNQIKINTPITGQPKTITINHKNGSFWITINYKIINYIVQNNPNNIASIDIGINNLLTITFNNNIKPIIISGKMIKSINQYYNKKKAEYQSKLPKNQKWSHKLDKLTEKRNLKITNIIQNITKRISKILDKHGIGTLIIGWNKDFKQKINIGKINNQKFTSIPHHKIITYLKDKCKDFINVIENEESYTSKASFIDNDVMPVFNFDDHKQIKFSGKRIKRGLYKSKNGMLLNADVNGSYNILRKVVPNVVFDEHGIEGFIVDPLRFKQPYELDHYLQQIA